MQSRYRARSGKIIISPSTVLCGLARHLVVVKIVRDSNKVKGLSQDLFLVDLDLGTVIRLMV